MLQQVYAHMPLSAHSTYYKDIIGNISSSDTITRSDNVSSWSCSTSLDMSIGQCQWMLQHLCGLLTSTKRKVLNSCT